MEMRHQGDILQIKGWRMNPFVILLLHATHMCTSAPGQVSMIFGGDVSFDGPVRFNALRGLCSYEHAFDHVRDELKKVDHVMVNLEGAVGTDRNMKSLDEDKMIRMLGDPKAIPALRSTNINLVSMANNHLLDCGEAAINTTVDVLRKNRIRYAGVTKGKDVNARQKPIILNTNGVKIGILAYCDNFQDCKRLRNLSNIGPAIMSVSLVKQEVRRLKKHVDVVVVFMHWAVEFNTIPDAGRTVTSAIKLQDCGIDLLLGAHPHVTQGHWYYGNMLVVYSLGNFLFPMTFSNARNFYYDAKKFESVPEKERNWYNVEHRMNNPTKFGRLLKVVFTKSGIVRSATEFLPISIDVNKKHCLQPTPMEDWKRVCSKKDYDCYGEYKRGEDLPELMGIVSLMPNREDLKGTVINKEI